MSAVPTQAPTTIEFPDHTQLPCEDGVPVDNAQQIMQGALLTSSLRPVLQSLCPAGEYFIGEDVGIYFERTNPPMLGCRPPDWYLVPDVPKLLDGKIRRSFVMWQEMATPLVLLEFASGDGSEERDRTPRTGKFWIYEKKIRPPFYGIFDFESGMFEFHHLVEDHFELLRPNAHGRYPIAALGIEIGVWQGSFQDYEASWLRWWDAAGNLLPTGEELVERLEVRAERLAAKLRELGVDPDRL